MPTVWQMVRQPGFARWVVCGIVPVAGALEPDLRALEIQILDAYDKAEGTARQPFITVSVTMKLARSLVVM